MEKPATEGQILHDSTYMSHLEYQAHRSRGHNSGSKGWEEGTFGVAVQWERLSWNCGVLRIRTETAT